MDLAALSSYMPGYGVQIVSSLVDLGGMKVCFMRMCMRAKLLQLCLALYNSIDCSLPRSSVRGILQARILEWVVMPSSRGSS